MTISPFEIYLVLQLDSIISAMMTAAIIGSVGVGFHALFVGVNNADGFSAKLTPTPRWAFVAVAVAFLVATFAPSSKTAAAMIILPPIVNEGLPAIGDEARELYELARDALERSVRPDGATPNG
jgi:uncharacterized membrane protein YdcZ (DUF606 family)